MKAERIALRVLTALIALRALTDVFKPLGAGSGLVFFGVLLSGIANAMLAPLVGIYMLVYCWGLWMLRSFAMPMGVAYAMYVTVNIIVFPLLQPLPQGFGFAAYAAFAAMALGGSWGAVWLLRRQLLA